MLPWFLIVWFCKLVTEIVDGNVKMTLGMIWTIILRFAIQDISVEGVCVRVCVNLSEYTHVINTAHKHTPCSHDVVNTVREPSRHMRRVPRVPHKHSGHTHTQSPPISSVRVHTFRCHTVLVNKVIC